MNLIPLVCGAVLAGKLLGFAYRLLYPGLGRTDRSLSLDALPAAFTVAIGLSVVLIAVSASAVALRRFRDKARYTVNQGRAWTHDRIAVVALLAAILVWVVGVFLPLAVQIGSTRLHWFGSAQDATGLQWAEARALLGIVFVGMFLGMGAVAVYCLSHDILPRLRNTLAAIAGPGILVVPFGLATQSEAVWGWRGSRDAAATAVLLLTLVGFSILAHNSRYSLHLYYRESLQSAFCLDRGDDHAARPVPYSERILLSDVARTIRDQRRDGLVSFPELVVCAAAAVRGGTAPHKAGAVSLTFEGEGSRIPDNGTTIAAPKIERRNWFGAGGVTLPSMMAVSGAALSPLMGRFTLPTFRLLMAVLNVRLGVWIENPTRRPEDADNRLTGLDRWCSEQLQRGILRRCVAKVWLGWREPGAWYVLREGLGLADLEGRFLYVSDGGHWENLGVVELLRRRCTHVFAIDASGDHNMGDLGRAASIARRDLGCEVAVRQDGLRPDGDGLVRDPVATGKITYSDGSQGRIYVARCALWPKAPEDLLARGRDASPFPGHSTTKQFFSGEEFEAYRSLGWFVGGELAGVANLPPVQDDESQVERSSEDPIEPVLIR